MVSAENDLSPEQSGTNTCQEVKYLCDALEVCCSYGEADTESRCCCSVLYLFSYRFNCWSVCFGDQIVAVFELNQVLLLLAPCT